MTTEEYEAKNTCYQCGSKDIEARNDCGDWICGECAEEYRYEQYNREKDEVQA